MASQQQSPQSLTLARCSALFTCLELLGSFRVSQSTEPSISDSEAPAVPTH